jgi:hypothetical protein
MSYPIPQNIINTMQQPVFTTNNTGPISVGGTGSAGQYMYSNGTTTTWADDTITLTNINTGSGTLQVKGNAEFDGDIKLKGKSLNDTLSKIEERLAILHPNERLEEKWAKLKELRKQYQELEADILEKEKIMEILKR